MRYTRKEMKEILRGMGVYHKLPRMGRKLVVSFPVSFGLPSLEVTHLPANYFDCRVLAKTERVALG